MGIDDIAAVLDNVANKSKVTEAPWHPQVKALLVSLGEVGWSWGVGEEGRKRRKYVRSLPVSGQLRLLREQAEEYGASVDCVAGLSGLCWG